jgi:hypothetical protein
MKSELYKAPTKSAVLKQGTTQLRKVVARWIAARIGDYNNGAEGVLKDLFHGGCQSGIVGNLIYYTDTCAFYAKHKQEIWDLVLIQAEQQGEQNPFAFLSALNGAKDIGSVDQFENLLAWYGFEETARIIAGDLKLTL